MREQKNLSEGEAFRSSRIYAPLASVFACGPEVPLCGSFAPVPALTMLHCRRKPLARFSATCGRARSRLAPPDRAWGSNIGADGFTPIETPR
jgi:hypothetical protein